MRAPKLKIKMIDKPANGGCAVCDGECVEDKLFYRKYTTRSMTNFFNDKDVIIYETYRCMPLLGDENNVAPGWEEHIVRYTVAFVKNNRNKNKKRNKS